MRPSSGNNPISVAIIIDIPDHHPLVRQTVQDVLHEATDVDGLEALLRRVESGAVRLHLRETTEPSPLAHEILNGRIGSATNVCVSELIPGQLCWCILTRKQRSQIWMPRDLSRCVLAVIIGFDESSHFGVRVDLVAHWRKELMLTTV